MDRPAGQQPTSDPPASPGPLVLALGITIRTDRIVQLTWAAFGVTAALFLLPVLSRQQYELLTYGLSSFYFLILAVVALRWRLNQLAHDEERQFWNDLSVAFMAWLVTASINVFFPERPFAAELVGDVCFTVYFAAFVLAIERQPHRRHRWRPTALERRLTWPAVTAFLVGFFLYFILIPAVVSRGFYDTLIPATHLYLVIDVYLVVRLIYSWWTSPSVRWRVIYLLLLPAAALVLVGDFIDYLIYSPAFAWQWRVGQNVLWHTLWPSLVLAARLRHHPFPPDPPADPDEDPLEGQLPSPLGQTMIFALLLPAVHFTYSLFGADDDPSRPYREGIVLLWVVLMGGIAVVQHQILVSTTRSLRRDRTRIAKALRASEREIRLIHERQATARTVRASEERFALAFRKSPDLMAITRLRDGRFLEANLGYERYLGFHPTDLVGDLVDELGVWHDPFHDEVVAQLEVAGRVAEGAIELRTRTGEPRWGLLSATTIDVDGEALMLSIIREVTADRRAEGSHPQSASYLDAAHSAIGAVAGDYRIRYWNRGAERLYGRRAEEVLEGSLDDLPAEDDFRRLLAACQEAGDRRGAVTRLRLGSESSGGRERLVAGRLIAVDQGAEQGPAQLLISTDAAPLEEIPAAPGSGSRADQDGGDGT